MNYNCYVYFSCYILHWLVLLHSLFPLELKVMEPQLSEMSKEAWQTTHRLLKPLHLISSQHFSHICSIMEKFRSQMGRKAPLRVLKGSKQNSIDCKEDLEASTFMSSIRMCCSCKGCNNIKSFCYICDCLLGPFTRNFSRQRASLPSETFSTQIKPRFQMMTLLSDAVKVPLRYLHVELIPLNSRTSIPVQICGRFNSAIS